MTTRSFDPARGRPAAANWSLETVVAPSNSQRLTTIAWQIQIQIQFQKADRSNAEDANKDISCLADMVGSAGV